jgi:hypothetical protein
LLSFSLNGMGIPNPTEESIFDQLQLVSGRSST